MSNLDLEQKYVDFVKSTIQNFLPNVEIFIFGSRTQDKALKYSDVDIAIKGFKAVPITDILKLKAAFQDSSFPYKIDLVDLNSVDGKFLEIIKNDLIKIN